MGEGKVQQQLLFTNQQEMIYPFLQQVDSFIKQYLPRQANEFCFKARVIIIELLTNSIKHSGNAPTQVELQIDRSNFLIKKIDFGKPFDIQKQQLKWPVNDIPAQPLKIYADHLNGLFANVLSPYSLRFYTEFYDAADDGDFSDISEHYGLMIICRASNSFVYEYDAQSSKNTFTVTIGLD